MASLMRLETSTFKIPSAMTPSAPSTEQTEVRKVTPPLITSGRVAERVCGYRPVRDGSPVMEVVEEGTGNGLNFTEFMECATANPENSIRGKQKASVSKGIFTCKDQTHSLPALAYLLVDACIGIRFRSHFQIYYATAKALRSKIAFPKPQAVGPSQRS